MPALNQGSPINANYIAKFANATSANNSAIYQNGAKIGIGTTTPQEKLTLMPNSNVGIEMPAPTGVTANLSSGGNLSDGNYYFVIVAEDGAGGTTIRSAEVNRTVNATSGRRIVL